MRNVLLFFICLCSVFKLSATENSFEFRGEHFIVSYADCDHDALTNLQELQNAMVQAAKASGATILSKDAYIFEPDGLTMVLLLSESHASIHTYPEHGACFVDLFTCGYNCSAQKFDAVLRDYLKPKTVNAKMLVRKKEIEDINAL